MFVQQINCTVAECELCYMSSSFDVMYVQQAATCDKRRHAAARGGKRRQEAARDSKRRGEVARGGKRWQEVARSECRYSTISNIRPLEIRVNVIYG